MPAGLEALPPPPTLPGPLPLAGQVLAVAFATVTGATNASPIVVTTAAPHYLVSGVAVTISGVVGNTAANTTAVATVLTPTTFSIPVAGNGAYASGGTVTVNVLAQSVVIADPTTPANQAGVTAGGALKVDASATTLPVSGSVGVSSLPAIPTGANAIGTVGVTALPTLPAGSNAIGTVGVTALPALPAGTNALGTVGVTALPALPAGTNALGSVVANAGTNLNTSALATESGGNLAAIAGNTGKIPAQGPAAKANATPVTIATDQPAVPTNAQIGAPLIPTGAANLTISTDGAYTFASQVHHVVVQNNTATAAGIAFDATATAGSYQVPANSERAFDLACTVLHLFSAAASAVNGTAAANIVVMGAV